MTNAHDDARWHLDRRVPLAIIFAIVTQTGAALLWAGAANERLAHLEMQMDMFNRMTERTTRLEVQVNYMRASLDRIERKLDRTIDPPPDSKN